MKVEMKNRTVSGAGICLRLPEEYGVPLENDPSADSVEFRLDGGISCRIAGETVDSAEAFFRSAEFREIYCETVPLFPVSFGKIGGVAIAYRAGAEQYYEWRLSPEGGSPHRFLSIVFSVESDTAAFRPVVTVAAKRLFQGLSVA